VVAQPLSQVVTVGQPVTFSATASGTATLSYQWLDNGSAISGATSSTYTIASVSAGSQGNYTVTVTNAFGNVTSSTATLIPVSAQPVAQTVTAGQSATFSVSPAGTGPYTYQWLFNGTVISGATSSSYTISSTSTSNAGSYSVIIADSTGMATTSPVSLIVNPGIEEDTPTMPPWALIILAALLFFMATRRQKLVI